MQTAAYTDKGKKRSLNEDSYLVKDDIFAVADGMGGHQAGEVASKTALKAVNSVKVRLKSPAEFLKQAFATANEQVLALAKAKSLQGMGTTLTVALVANNELWIGHVGDSRAYLITDGQLKKLTTDHSLVNNLVKAGELSEEEAKTDPRKHVITKAIGSQEQIVPDITTTSFKTGDILLLCTDGLTNELSESEILNIVAFNPPAKAGEKLVKLANEHGGADNITVVIAALQATAPVLKKSASKWLSFLTAVGLLLVVVFSFSHFLNGQYFLTVKNNRVAVYQGWPVQLGPLKLWHLQKLTPIKEQKLPLFYRKRLKEKLYVGNKKELQQTLNSLKQVMRK